MWQNPVKLPAMTNRESWTLSLALQDNDTGDPIRLVDDDSNPIVSLQFEVRRSKPGRRSGSGNVIPWYDFAECDTRPVLTASIGGGITIVTELPDKTPIMGRIEVYFTQAQMETLGPETWDVGCVMTSLDGFDALQLFRGVLPIQRGFVKK